MLAMDFTSEQLQLIEEYCENDLKKLKSVCYHKIRKACGNSNMDEDDMYSIAMDILMKSAKTFDASQGTFQTLLSRNIQNKINSYIRDTKYRHKRSNIQKDKDGKLIFVPDVPIDAPNEEGIDLKERITSGLTIEDELADEIGLSNDDKIEQYLNSLTSGQKEIAKLIMCGYMPCEIKKKLDLTEKEYENQFSILRSYEKKRILYKDNYLEEEKMDTGISMNDVTETYKNTSYCIESISKQLQKKRIRDDHILQRHSGLWKRFAKSELISDILRGKSLTQIIISEEIKNGVRMQWLIDGKQRCTTLDDYLHDGFAISKNVKNYNIRYQITKVDEEGNELLNEEGFPITEFKEFDVRGKKFSKLPEELQEIFKDRQIPVLYNMNCTKKDIADDIARFNRSRPMTKAQNGWLGLDECFAEFVENIVKMPFFQPEFYGSAYTNANHTSGIIRRLVVEAVMVTDFIDEFGDFEKMCEFLSEEASDSNFTEFYSLVERLTAVCNKDIAKLFDAKDSFLWLGLFSRFVNTGLEDKRFVEFLEEFSSSDLLQNKKLNGVSYRELCVDKETGKSKGTKDKYIVVSKMELLEKIMLEFLHVESEESESDKQVVTENVVYDDAIADFISECVDIDIESARGDIDFYNQFLDDITEEAEIPIDSNLLNEENRPSLLAIVAYSYKEDVNLEEWLADYVVNDNTYKQNQKDNFVHMKRSLHDFLRRQYTKDDKMGGDDR